MRQQTGQFENVFNSVEAADCSRFAVYKDAAYATGYSVSLELRGYIFYGPGLSLLVAAIGRRYTLK